MLDDNADKLCVPSTDSPGNLNYRTLNMSKPNVAANYLAAILDDGCLQVWSAPYARYFWYGISVFVTLCVLRRILGIVESRSRMKAAASGGAVRSGCFSTPINLARGLFNLQFTPLAMPRFFKLPPVGYVLMVATYFGFLMGLTFTKTSTGDDQTLISMGVRAGWLSVAQVPLIVLLASKRNLIDLLTAVSYERLNILHRWVARGLLVTTSLHFGLQSTAWARAGVMQLEWATDTCPPTGIAAYALVLWMNLSTLAPFRNMAYEFFVFQHIVTFMGLIIAIMFHLPSTAYYTRVYIYIAVALYLCSRIVQTVFYAYRNVKRSKAVITPVSSEITKVVLTSSNLKSWRPGSFVLLSIPRFGILQSHPASIASTPTSDDGKLVFYLRKHRGFTKNISAACDGKQHTAQIDGPYGGQQPDFAAFQTVLLVAGSTGITFTMPILINMAERAAHTALVVKRIFFIWAIKQKDLPDALSATLQSAISRLQAAGIQVTFRLQVTGFNALGSDGSNAVIAEKLEDANIETKSTDSDSTPSSPSTAEKPKIFPQRPNLQGLLQEAQEGSTGEMGVTVCGPLSMSKDMRNAVAGLQLKGHGVQLHVEGFSW